MELRKTHVIYYFFLLVGLTVYLLQKSEVLLPYFVRNYLNDILIMPLMLKFITILLKRLYGADFRLTNFHLLIIWIYFSFLFEFIFPLYLDRYTADFFDIIAYLVGVLIFKLIEQNGTPD